MKTTSPKSKFMSKILIAYMLFACISTGFSQEKLSKGTWKSIDESSIPLSGTRYIQPTKYLTLKLNLDLIRQQLIAVKRLDNPSYTLVYLTLPKPDGTYGTYQVYENETMSVGLAEQFPEIKSYDGIAIDNSGEVVKFDLTPQGFHAMTLTPGKPTTFIDPYSFGGGDIEHYIVYSKADYRTDKVMTCELEASLLTDLPTHGEVNTDKSYGNCTKRTYRLALSATAEYTSFQGGTVALAQAAQVTTMNRVNGVYMKDLAVTLTIIPNNNLLIYTNAGSDPYTNGNPNSMINQNQTNTTTVIGSANYDIGHVFGTNSGGLAGLGVVCNNSQKASGVTGSGAPVGDAFDIDYVAHEMGHEFSGNHSFRGNAGSCSGNANGPTAMEPGSGSSIMAYAGICSPQDVQPHSDDNFHGVNMKEMHIFINGSGNSCAVSTAIPNQSAPVINSQSANVTIPISTPFALTASATDVDGDVLTYCWEQMDNQNSTQPPVATATSGPNFRSRSPQTSGTRYFPSIASQLTNGPYTWEVLPSVSRTMNFRCVVRDNEAGGGCNDDADVVLTVSASAGPFIVNYPSATGITWPGGSNQTVTWSVANTNNAPVSCANVDIMLSTDGGVTFTVIDNDVPNDGSEDITVPNIASTNALIIVMCENGVFFDVSNNKFTITAATNDYNLNLANNTASACQGTNLTYTVNVGQIGTYSIPVNLSVTGIPAPASAVFSPNPVTPGGSTTLTISNTAGVTPGTYPISINGVSTSGNHSINATLLISNTTSTVSTLNLPVNMEPNAAIQPTLTWTNSGAGMSYDVEIATDATFSNIIESANNLSANSYVATTLAAGTSYFWRVNSYNSCSSGGLSSTFQFTTASCGSYSSTNIPVIISTSGTPTITSTLTVPSGGTITDLNVVNLAGTHTYINDLTFTLKSPAGTSVVLFNQICDDENDFNLNLDDEATPGALPCPPVGGGSYQPSSPLSAFDGENMSGIWTLTVADHFNQDGGSLNSWGLQICFSATAPCNAPDVPTISGNNSFCPGGSTTLSIGSGNLNDASNWAWTSGSCGGTVAGSGNSLVVSTPGTYYVRGLGGCVTSGTCQSINITQTTINTTVTLNGGMLSSNQASATYIWLDCNNGNAPIAGATSQTYSPTVNGNYAVQVTRNGCTATSSCTAFNSAGLEELDFNVVLYPNPTTGKVTLSFDNEKDIETMTLTDLTGRLVNAKQSFVAQSIELDLSSEAAGVYFLNIEISGKTKTFRIAKQ